MKHHHGVPPRCNGTAAITSFAISWLFLGGCVPVAPPDGGSGAFNNTTDPTNKGASYIGSAACISCHTNVADKHTLHAHAHALTAVEGLPPTFPPQADRAVVPDPPPGFDWTDISYVIGGYTHMARFVDVDGFRLTTGATGVPTQWNLLFGVNNTQPGFVNYADQAAAPPPYTHDCFRCHTTGPVMQSLDDPRFQENRPGILGTWAEAGVQCEACHGPGSNHAPNPSARDLFVDRSASACGQCHSRNNLDAIEAVDGFILNYQQQNELRASGGHASFNCTFCHDPHASPTYDRDNAIRNACTSCHAGHTMAGHRGRVFVRGSYVEELSCVSCHMQFASKSTSSATPDVAGPIGRIGDLRTHIFRINTDAVTSEAFFTEDGSAVRKDDQGRAAVTLDYICFRCHNDLGNAPSFSLSIGSGVAQDIHVFDSFGE
jgi:hypothetical protein